jgi:hypothetical protein
VVSKPPKTQRRSPSVDLSTFIISVFCLTDDWLKGKKLRQRGPSPELSDAEVITIEIVGEVLGIDTDEGLYEHFSRHYGEWFPALRGVHRTTSFLRQGANLWVLKKMLWKHLLGRIRFDPEVSLIDSSPVPVCHFARAYRCRRLAEESAFGYDEMTKQTFYGLRVHLRVCWPGVIVDVDLAPANAHDLHLGRGTARRRKGLGFGGQKLLECRPHRATRRQRIAFAGSLQVQEEGRGALAALARAKETLHRDGDL